MNELKSKTCMTDLISKRYNLRFSYISVPAPAAIQRPEGAPNAVAQNNVPKKSASFSKAKEAKTLWKDIRTYNL